jgi:predicted enzyme related to lactoylglutathione lyase
MKLNLYVLVRDMSCSTAFYRDVFQREPVIQTPGFTAFALGDALYGLFDAANHPQPVYGSNVVPNILVEDLDALYSRLKNLASPFHSEISANGPYRLFLFSDPDMNVIEFFAQAS